MSKSKSIAPAANKKTPYDVYIFFGILIASFVLVIVYGISLYLR